MTLNYDSAALLLEKNGQEHVLSFWNDLSEEEKSALLRQVESIDFDDICNMRSVLQKSGAGKDGESDIEPADVVGIDQYDRQKMIRIGEEIISDAQAGVILVAGGQGSRLGFDGPKGCYPIGPITNKTLFEIHADKILAMERKYSTHIPFYIMTSQANDAETRKFFHENKWFGLDEDRVMFFTQNMWPVLWGDGRFVMDRPDHIFMSPDGHGGLLTALRKRGMIDDMRSRGLKTLFYFQVDNPLVEIADPAFLGIHLDRGADISVKVCEKRSPDEKVGVVVRKDGHFAVAEYSELKDEQIKATTPEGALKFRYGSVAIHVLSLDFLEQESSVRLPLHLANKKVPYCDDDGNRIEPEQPNAYKFEKFIFDVLEHTESVVNLEFEREEEFSPVKKKEGDDSPDSAKRDMVRKYARRLEEVGVKVPRDKDGNPIHLIEINPYAVLDVKELRKKIGRITVLEDDLLLN